MEAFLVTVVVATEACEVLLESFTHAPRDEDGATKVRRAGRDRGRCETEAKRKLWPSLPWPDCNLQHADTPTAHTAYMSV